MKLKKLTIVMMLTVLGLVSPTGDISMDVVDKLNELDIHSWNELRKSLCYVSHKNKPVVHGMTNYGDHPIYPDGFRWAEIKLDSSTGRKSLRISNRLISNGQNARNEMHHCMGQDNTEYLKEFHNIGYPVVYFGYFSQRKVVLNTSHEHQKEEEEYRNLLDRYRKARIELKFDKEAEQKFKAIQEELKEKEPDLLLNRYRIESEETPQLRLYFKRYNKDEAEYYNGKTLALYIDNPTTEDLGLAMSVCKVAHRCVELNKDTYKKLKKHNNAQENEFYESSLEAQTKGAHHHLSEEEFLIHKRLSRVFMQDFLTYGGKRNKIYAGIGAVVGFFSKKADSAIRNQFDDMYKEQKPKMLDSNRLMLATIVGFGGKEQLTNSAIQCNILAYQEGFYRYLLKGIEKALANQFSYKEENMQTALRLVGLFEKLFFQISGLSQRRSISESLEKTINNESQEQDHEIQRCNNEFTRTEPKRQDNYRQYSFLEKRVKLRRHRLARKFNIGTVVEVFKAIKEFFIKTTGVVVAIVNLVVHIVSTVIFGVIYAVSIVAEALGGLAKVTTDFMIGETHISNIFLLPSQAINAVLGPIASGAYKIKNETLDTAFTNLVINQFRKIWVQNELFYEELDSNKPVTLSTYMMFSKKPETINNIFRILLSK